jgi:two-component system, chemotaxis family, chemotaxis protein CheY
MTRQNVLLVDDSATIRNIIKIYLMGLNLTFVEAASGEDALELLAGDPVDLVIADVNMPGMDGLSLIRRLRADSRGQVRGVPVILLTAEQEPDLEARGVQAGANAFVKKPVSSANLRETFERVFAENTAQ